MDDSEQNNQYSSGDSLYAQYLQDIIAERKIRLIAEFEKVAAAPDPEPIHDLRVSIRRLSAALKIYSDLGLADSSFSVLSDLKKIMRPLGELRDLQVRIELLAGLGLETMAGPKKILGPLRKQEKELIDLIPAALARVDISSIRAIDQLQLTDQLMETARHVGVSLDDQVDQLLNKLLGKVAKRVRKYRKRDDFEMLHRTRISFKRYRYSIEIFSKFYKDVDLKQLHRFQTLLGDFHDYDLIISWLGKSKKEFPKASPETISSLIAGAKKKRDESLAAIEGFIADDFVAGREWRKEMEIRRRPQSLAEARSLIERLQLRYDPEPDHARHVALLALQIFDGLQDAGVHDLGDNLRYILEYGCLLHDIGWVGGQSGHNKRSYEMIRKSMLPVAGEEIEMIAQVARFHRKNPPQNQKCYLKLDAQTRDQIAKLSAIIRIADGLDRLHTQTAEVDDVELAEHGVVIRVGGGVLKRIHPSILDKKSSSFAGAFGIRVFLIES